MQKRALAVMAAGLGVAIVVALQRRESLAASPPARAVADRVASGADRAAQASREATDRLQAGMLRAADTVERAAESVAERFDDATEAAAVAAEAVVERVAEKADWVATSAIEATTTDRGSSHRGVPAGER